VMSTNWEESIAFSHQISTSCCRTKHQPSFTAAHRKENLTCSHQVCGFHTLWAGPRCSQQLPPRVRVSGLVAPLGQQLIQAHLSLIHWILGVRMLMIIAGMSFTCPLQNSKQKQATVRLFYCSQSHTTWCGSCLHSEKNVFLGNTPWSLPTRFPWDSWFCVKFSVK
jgi:hypothetical protein